MGKTLGYGEITVANMTEPFTVMLTNEAQQFATDSNRKVTSAQSYYTDIIVIRGSQERTDYTIGNITSGSGITVSKNSKRVTFSVSAGTTIGADAGVIEIPITLDGQTVKKQFSWSCGKQGPQGVKGDPGTSVKITSKSVTYQTSTSGTTAPTGTWSTTVPMVNNGQYLWTKTTVQYSDGNKTEAYSVSYKGTNGTNGTSVTVSKTEVTYQVSTSGTTAPTGTWSTTMPSCDQGQYLWTKTYVKYSDGKETTSYSVSYKGVDGEKFSWNLIQNGKGNEKRGFFKNFSSVNITEGYGEITLTSKHNYIGIGLSGFVLTPRQYEVGKKVTWSYDIMYTKWDFPTGTNHQEFWLGQRYTNAPSGETATGQWVGVTAHDLPVVGQNGCELNKWFHVEVTKTIPTQASSNVGHQEVINFYNSTDISATVTFRMKNVKLEYGDTATPWSPSQSDLEGRGVSQTVQYYLATSQASGVTSSTSGWSTDITTQKLTADKKYLWNCYQTKYSDGTSEPISTPKVIGVYGDKGTSTKIIRTGYKYTQNNIDTFSASGYSRTWDTADATTGLKVGDNVLLRVKNTTKGSDCLIFASITAIPSNYSLTCTSYGLIDNGADGQDGKNAKNLSITPSSQYFKSTDGGKTFAPNTITIKPTIQGEISFGKWQYSIDGGVSFADVVSGQKGLTVSNNVLTVSKDSSLYSDAVTMVTFRAVASDSSFYDTCSIAKIYDVSDIGDGRNLWITRDNITLQACEKDKYIYTTTGTSAVCIGADATSVGTNIIALQTGTKYTISFVISSPSEVGNARWYFCTALNSTGVKNYGGYGVKLVTGENIVSQTITVDTSCDAAGLVIYNLPTDCIIKDIQVEKGSSPTGWTPAPEDFQMAILSTKSEIFDVSLKVDNNKQAIEQRVEKTTYQQDLKLVKGDISKANEGLNKWRYEIYPKSLFASEYQGKSTMDVFAKNTNLTPSQSVLINDTDLSIAWNYDNNYIGYALTFAKFSAAKSVAITFAHDDGAHIYLNGKLIGGSDAYSQTGESLTLGFVKGWNCIEVVVNEGASTEGFKLGTTISAISECQLMNCYYGTPVARQSHITNQLVENTTNIEGVTTTMQKVMTTVGGSDRIDEFVNNYNKTIESEKQFKKTIGETYTTKDEFNGLEIGGRNLLLYSQTIRAHNDYYGVGWLTDEVETFNGCPVWSVKNQWGRLTWLFKSHVIDRGLVKVGDTLTYSLYAKTNNASGKSINCSYRFKGNANAYWFNASAFNIGTSWARYSVTFTVTKDMLATDTYMNEIGFEETASMSGDDKVYYACPKLERGTKATDYTPAPEDDEINGQNLVSNLPSNWEQGTVTEGSTTGTTYANTKSSSAGSVRPKELIPVSGNITISTAYSNQSKKPIRHWIAAYDINKNYLGNNYVSNAWNSFPRTLNMKDAKYIAIMVGYTDSSAITPSDISQICLKIERGTSATPFTLAPEDVNGKIVNVETIANQTAKKFEWIVKGGDSSSNFTLTDRVADLVAERINFNGLVTFSGLSTDAKNEIGKVAQSKVDGLEVGGRNLALQSKDFTSGEQYWSINSNFTRSVDSDGFTVLSIKRSGAGLEWNRAIPHNYIPVEEMHRGIIVSFDFMCDKVSELDRGCICALQIFNSGGGRIGWYESQDILSGAQCKLSAPLSDGKWIRVQIPFSEGNLKATYGNSDAVAYTSVSFNLVANGSIHFKKIKIEYGNKATDWTPAPEDVSQDATNKASQALTDAKNYSSSAVNWVTSNGSSTISLNSMVKKWTDGAVSDTTQINGGWIKANTITASKIALADFTNYSQLTRDTAATYGFAVTDDTDGTWFSTQGIRRDQFISETFPCNGGESYLIEYDISTNAKGANNSTDTKNYIGVAVGVYGYTGTVGSNGLPNKATNIWYADRITGSETSPSIHVKTTITTSTATKQFRVFLQSNGYYFEGTTKIRNLSVRRMYGGTLIVDGSITADKIATDAIKSRNYISSGGTQGSFLNLSDGSFTSPNLSWDSNGNLIAKNANLSGQITATIGSIGGWNIGDTSLFTGITKSNVRIYDAVNADNAQNMYQKEQHSLILANTYINSFNSSLNSSDNYWHAQGVTINDGEFQVGETLYNPNLVNSDKDEVYYDRGLTRVFGGYITMSRDCSINSDSRSLYADIILNGEELYICTNRNILFSPLRTSIFTTEDPSKYNAIETTGDAIIGGNMVLRDRSNGNHKVAIYPYDGCIEMYGNAPYIDFHYGSTTSDYTSRIIAQSGWDCLTFTGSILLGGDIYNSSNGHYTWDGKTDAYLGCGNYSGGNNIYYYANYHAFYVNNDLGSGMMYINTNGVTSRVGFTKTSDERIKKNFESFDDNIIDAYMNIEPVKYQLKQSSNDNYHFGFKAQHVDKVFSDYGDIYNESFDICTSRPIDPDKAKGLYGVDDMTEEYGLRYDELIAPTTYMVQHIYKELESTKGELAKVKQEKTDLETRLQAIEAKLGLHERINN